ncbi:MAG: amidase [Candidatus Omnitrophica bacterium]|nr:amidase [Candidatus Omnitrophota bacterium]
MKPFYQLTATQAISQINKGVLSSKALVQSCLDRIKETDPIVQAWVCLDADKGLEQAEQIDRGPEKDILSGVPVGIKDIFNTHDFPTCMGSSIWKGFMPGNDARVVTNIKRAGGVVFGKTVTAEFAVHHPGPTKNPYSLDHIAGTSSTGSAVAVATGQVPLAIGTQTAGSTIRPASYVGIYGYKPSFGVVPRTGVLKTLDTLDHVTWFARCIEDLELMLDVCRVHGPNYPFVYENFDLKAKPNKDRRWKVAFVKTHVWDQAESYTRDSMEKFADLLRSKGITVNEENIPEKLSRAHQVHQVIYQKALSYYFQEEYKNHKDQISPIMQEMIEQGQKISIQDYHAGLDQQNQLARCFTEHFQDYDIVLSHSTTGQAPLIDVDEKPDPCLVWTLCRLPVIGVPVFKGPDGLPFGAQLVAKHYDDYSLLAFGRHLKDLGILKDAEVANINAIIETK